MKITYEWEDGKTLALTAEQAELTQGFAAPGRLYELLRFLALAELPNVARKE